MTSNRLLITGANGIGKSNFLEAVELLGNLRSHRCTSDQDLICWGEDKSILRAIAEECEHVGLDVQRRGGRKAYRNGKLLTRQLDLIGPLRCVGFSALDLSLIRGQPILRRNWLDRVVLQLEPIYLDLLSRFNKLLRQRSQIWRRSITGSSNDRNMLLDTFDVQMALISTRIHRRRSRALKHLLPLAIAWQKRLSNGNEDLDIMYVPGCIWDGHDEELSLRLAIQDQLQQQRNEEEKVGSCRIGPHRDEVSFLINGSPSRRFASSGQQRTIVLSLKLAELELLKKLHNDPPILLLDDVLAELDPERQLLLLEAVGEEHQCLISTTHLDAFDGNWQRNSQIVELESVKTL